MASSNFNLQKFQSEVLSRGLARTNRFEVIIDAPSSINNSREGSNMVSLLAESAGLPLLNLTVRPFKIFGPSYQMPTTSDYGGDGISLSFHVDRQMKVKRFFEDWMHAIVNKDTYTVSYQASYVRPITIKQLDELDNITYAVELVDAFPRNMNLLELNNAASNQTHRLNVVFAYRKWKNLNDVVTNPVPTNRPLPVIPTPVGTAYKNVAYTGVFEPGTTNEG